MEIIDLSQDEADTIESLRRDEPCIILNTEAAEILELLAQNCDCPSCRFIRRHLEMMAMFEARTEGMH